MRGPDLNDYLPILLMLGFGVFFAVAALGVSWLLGQKGRKSHLKDRPYECGMPIQSEAHSRFGVKFYLVAVLFILFDVEVVFMYPWAVSYGTATARVGAPPMGLLLAEVAAFVLILFVGWAYVVKKGVLEWHKED